MEIRGPVPTARSLAVLAAIIIALALAMSNLAPAEGEAVDTGSSVQQISEVVILILMSVGLGMIAWLIIKHLTSEKQGTRGTRPGRGNSSLGLLIFLVIILIIMLAMPRALVDSSLYPDGGDQGPTDEGDLPADQTDDGLSGVDTNFMIVVVALAVAVLLFLILRSVRRREETSDRLVAVQEMRAKEMVAISTSIEEIVSGGDVREVILLTYRRMLRLQASAGASPSLTAHELARLLVERRGWPSSPTGSLTHLFEEAKYSQHPLGEDHRQEALVSLGSIEEWLGGGEARSA